MGLDSLFSTLSEPFCSFACVFIQFGVWFFGRRCGSAVFEGFCKGFLEVYVGVLRGFRVRSIKAFECRFHQDHVLLTSRQPYCFSPFSGFKQDPGAYGVVFGLAEP